MSNYESVHINPDGLMDDHKQKVINSFRQGHLIQNYNAINDDNKEKLNLDLELLELDVVDLVSQKNPIISRITTTL